MRLEPLFEMNIDLGKRYSIGQIPKGKRTVWALARGTVSGTRVSGEVMPVGGEFELIDSNGIYYPDVRLVIKTSDDANIFVQYFGVVSVTPEMTEKLKRGEATEFGELHFVTQPRFECSHPKYSWLNTTLAIAEGRTTGTGVAYRVYEGIPTLDD